MKHLEQLRYIQQLIEDGIISESKFTEHKQIIIEHEPSCDYNYFQHLLLMFLFTTEKLISIFTLILCFIEIGEISDSEIDDYLL